MDPLPGPPEAGALLDQETAAALADLFKALADPVRLRLLARILGGEACVHELCEALRMSQPAISHHLRLLRAMRLVSRRRDGRHLFYRLDDEHVRSLLVQALSHARHAPGTQGGPA